VAGIILGQLTGDPTWHFTFAVGFPFFFAG
jgi:hypothetical protein